MDAKLKSFLDLIGWSEGTTTHPLTQNDGYDVIVTGIEGPRIFTDYRDHPFADGGSVVVTENPRLISTAAGRYQIMAKWWKPYQAQLGLPDFSPQSQDAYAIQQIKERRAIPMIEAADIEAAVTACSNIWASFPGNDYGQHAHPMERLVGEYNRLLASNS